MRTARSKVTLASVAIATFVVIQSACVGTGNRTVVTAIPAQRAPEVAETPTPSVATLSTPGSTAVPIALRAKFSLVSSDQIAPADVLKQIAYFPPGGAGAEECTRLDIRQPSIYVSSDDALYTPDVEPSALLFVEECGFAVGEVLSMTMQYPDGRVLSRSGVHPNSVFSYQTTADDPSGVYTFIVTGTSGVARDSITVAPPAGPRLRISTYKRDVNGFQIAGELALFNFAPNERIRLLVYRPAENAETAQLAGWSEFQMDASGRLQIELDDVKFLDEFIVLGETSGVVHHFPWSALGHLTDRDALAVSNTPNVIPSDILRQVVFAEGQPIEQHVCPEGTSQPTLMPYASGASPANEVERAQALNFSACGWPPGVLVRQTIRYPSGYPIIKHSYSVPAAVTDASSLVYELRLQDPTGEYVLEWAGSDGSVLRHSVVVKDPLAPRLYWDWRRHQLHLVNFEPNEKVRAFAYKSSFEGDKHIGTLEAWRQLQVDDSGRGLVNVFLINDSSYAYIAIGEASGEVFASNAAYNLGGALGGASISTGLDATRSVEYVIAILEALPILGSPEATSQVVASVPIATAMKPIEARLVEGAIWWNVTLPDGTRGWVPDAFVYRVRK